LLFLEKELVSLGAMCAASLLKEDTVLPFAGTYVYEYQSVLYTCAIVKLYAAIDNIEYMYM